MKQLRDYFRTGTNIYDKYSRTGVYSWELYAARASDFWLSPSYGKHVVRIGPFFFGYKDPRPRDPRYSDSAEEFFAGAWSQLVSQFDVRFRWGKYIPRKQTPNAPSQGWPKYVCSQYPKWSDFAALRAKLDPKGLFINPYWSERLDFS